MNFVNHGQTLDQILGGGGQAYCFDKMISHSPSIGWAVAAPPCPSPVPATSVKALNLSNLNLMLTFYCSYILRRMLKAIYRHITEVFQSFLHALFKYVFIIINIKLGTFNFIFSLQTETHLHLWFEKLLLQMLEEWE